MADFARELVAARRARKMSRYRLAKLTDLEQSHLKALEDGKIENPRIDTLEKLRVVLPELSSAGQAVPKDHDEPRVEHTVLVRIEGVAVGER